MASSTAGFSTNSLFEEPWWLDAVSPGAWSAVESYHGGELVGRLPFARKSRFGLTRHGMPPLTQQLGPWIRQAQGKPSSQISWSAKVVTDLVAKLPHCDIVRLNLHYSFLNWTPLYSAGFSGTVLYSYQLRDLSDPGQIWANFDGSVRTDIRKAERILNVRDDLPLDAFLRLNDRAVRIEGGRKRYAEDLVRRIDEACCLRDARRMFFAEDASGSLHAAMYLVWDRRSAYYLMGPTDPALRGSAAMTLLMWHAIRFAASVTEVFDFEGSMLPSVEPFFRGFGAKPMPYFRVTRYSRRYTVLDSLLRILGPQWARGTS